MGRTGKEVFEPYKNGYYFHRYVTFTKHTKKKIWKRRNFLFKHDNRFANVVLFKKGRRR